MSCCASSVEPAMCGVRMTFFRPRSSDSNGSPAPAGSSGKTSIAAPAMCPLTMCSLSAIWSTRKPRRKVEEARTRPHPPEQVLAEEAAVTGSPVHVEGDDVRGAQQLLDAAAALSVPQRQFVGCVVEEHLHAHRLGEYRELAADVAVADDAQCAAAQLVAARRRLLPDPAVHVVVVHCHPPCQGDDLGD